MLKRTDSGRARRGEAGFSLFELLIALGVTLTIMVISSKMLAMTMAVRTRENQRSEAIADVQRALHSMTRDISNAGLGMFDGEGDPSNGLVDADSNALAIRVRTNLNAFCGVTATCDEDTGDPAEDLAFGLITRVDATGHEQTLITRQDVNSDSISALANRIDALSFQYLKADGTAADAPSEAERVRITVVVTLDQVGTEGQDGFQPTSQMRLESDAVLRNFVLGD